MAQYSDPNDKIGNESGKPRLADQIHQVMRRKHYSLRTEQTYVQWIKRFIVFHGKRHPATMGEAEVTAFLNHLAATRNVAAATQNQALNAILFLYRDVLDSALGWIENIDRAKKPVRLPVVLTAAEVDALLSRLEGTK